MTEFGCIAAATTDRLAQVSIDWPAPSGCIKEDVLRDLESLVDWLEDDTPCDAVILRLRPLPPTDQPAPAPDIDQCRRWEKLLIRVDRLPCISVAIVEGACVRFWMQLALACDHRLATTDARFQVHEVREGYLPGMNIFRLAKYIGIGAARRFVFTGEPLDAATAASLGIVDQVCAPNELELVSRRFLARLRPIHPVTVQLARRLLNESFSTAFEQFLGQYLASQHRCLSDAPSVTPSKAQ